MTQTFLQLFSEAAEATESAATQETVPETGNTQETAVQADVPNENNDQTDVSARSDAVAAAEKQESTQDLLLARRIAEGRARMQDWAEQGEQLKAFYPSFSLRDEYNGNEEFAQLLRAGVSVRQAYEATHLPQILSAAMRYAARKAAEKTANAVRNAAFRPQENGLHDRRAGLPTDKSVDSLTQADIIRILERVGKGDKITF